MARLQLNDYQTTQSGGATSGATSIAVAAAISGAGAADTVRMRNARTGEIFDVTAGGDSTTWTVSRAVEDATRFPAAAMLNGDVLEAVATAAHAIAPAFLGPRPYADLLAYGADATGTVAADTALDAAVAALPSGGGVIYVPQGIYKIASTHTFTKEVSFRGAGTSGSNLDNDANLSTRPLSVFLWSGGAAVMFEYNNGSRALHGLSWENIAVDGATTATIGLKLDRVRMSTFTNVRIARCATNCLWLGTTSATANDNCQLNQFTNLSLERAPTPLYLTGNAGNTANTCHNVFTRLTVDFTGDPGIDLVDCDNNLFFQIFGYRRSGTGYGIRSRGWSRANYFYGVEAGTGGVYWHTNLSGGTAGSVIFGYDRENGQAAPTVEAGAQLTWTEDGRNASNGWVVAQQGGVFNVKAFGATGDGTTDDIEAIQAALRALPTRGGVLYFPAGDYRVSKPIYVQTTSGGDQSITLAGDGFHFDPNDATNAQWSPATVIRGSGASPAAGTYAPLIQLGALPGTYAPVLTGSTTGGTLAAATYYYRVVAYDAAGVQIGYSAESSVVTTGATSSVVVRNYEVRGATSYRVYRGTSAGGENVYYTTSGTSYTDTNAASTGGSPTAFSPIGGIQIRDLALDGSRTATHGILADRWQTGACERVGVRNLNSAGAYPNGTGNESPGIADPGVAPTVAAVTDATSTLAAGRYYVKYAWQGVTSGLTLPSPESAVVAIAAGQALRATWTVHPSGGETTLYLTAAGGAMGSETLAWSGRTGTTADVNFAPLKAAGLELHTTGAADDNCYNLRVDSFYASQGVPTLVRLRGNVAHTANASHNFFSRISGTHLGDGVDVDDADNNTFTSMFLFRATQIAAGYSVVLGPWARANYLFHVEAMGGLLATIPEANANESNVVFGYDRDNNEPAPVRATVSNLVVGAATAGGSLTAGTYRYYVYAYDATGKVIGRSTEVSGTTATTNLTLPLSSYAVTGAVAYRIWRSPAGGASGTENVYYDTTATSFNDTGAAATSGTLPLFNPANLTYTEDGRNASVGWLLGRLTVLGEKSIYSATPAGFVVGQPGFAQNYTGASFTGVLSTTTFNLLAAGGDSSFYINRASGGNLYLREANSSATQVLLKPGQYWSWPALAEPGSPAAGDLWYGSTQKSWRFQTAAAKAGLVGLIYANTADDALASGGTAELKFASQIALAAAGLTVGKVIRVRLRGTYTTDATASQTATIRFKLGDATNATSGTLVATTVLALTASLTNANWSAEVDIVVRSATTVWAAGAAMVGSTVAAPWTTAATVVSNGGGVGTVTTIPNISTAHTVHATGQPNDTGMTITLRTMTVELLD